MKEELEKKLVEAYPDLFKQYGGLMTETCMAFGVECGDGWYDLLEEVCKDLSALNEPIEFAQIKEKWGALRIYLDNASNQAYEIISKAEEKSEKICESCGSLENVKRSGVWVKTLCDTCRGGK